MATSNFDPSQPVIPFLTYKETLDYLYARLPMFTRIGAAALKADLTNTIELCNRLDNPHNSFKSIHLAGTNGKGSTSHMIAAILQTAGYKTGLYTSPHLKDFRERIRLDGKMIPQEFVIDFINRQRINIEEIDPSFFEVTVALAFHYFALEKVDIAVVEVGLGGRLDSTNIISPVVSVITNIGYDHMNLLGNTLAEIASEKAGIIKPGIPVVVGEKHAETTQIFLDKADANNSEITFACDKWKITRSALQKNNEVLRLQVEASPSAFLENDLTELELDLTGSYQIKNLATVLSSVEELRKAGFIISDDHIKTALKKVKELTGLEGRWQILKQKPLIICDTGHNEDGIREVLKNIASYQYNNLHMVIGMVKDKDISKILALLPQKATYYFCSPHIPRAKSASELKDEAFTFGLIGKAYQSVRIALNMAEKNASDGDLVFVGGSTFVVAEVV